MSLTIEQLNAATPADFVALLDGTYEHSPWIAERAAALRPFTSLAHLKHALVSVVRGAGTELQLAHQERNATVAAYNHATYLKDRRAMMCAWADHLDRMRKGARVIELHGKVA